VAYFHYNASLTMHMGAFIINVNKSQVIFHKFFKSNHMYSILYITQFLFKSTQYHLALIINPLINCKNTIFKKNKKNFTLKCDEYQFENKVKLSKSFFFFLKFNIRKMFFCKNNLVFSHTKN
jgi:hypothetical protein